MSRSTRSVCAALLYCLCASVFAQAAPKPVLSDIGRAATPAELKAWDIDVRADFKGLPEGKGDVGLGEAVWEEKCATCHGTFGESNEVFTPLVGGTTREDITNGRVQNLAQDGYPHRTTLMKSSHLSTLWDYINRAMPWDAPKSLTPDEVYGVLAYLLNLGDIVPADFTLSKANMAEVQDKLPNRHGKVFYSPMWIVTGAGDVDNEACMKDCPIDPATLVKLPDEARNTHGNIAEQVRPFGPARGTDTTLPPRTARVGSLPPPATNPAPDASKAAARAGPADSGSAGHADAVNLVKAKACTACHGLDRKIVGPGFNEVSRKYAGKPEAVDYLVGKILEGGQGVWGAIPMPAQAQLKEEDARVIAGWLANGNR
jgi:S-disulfanyl-L-cysteine oxidoreductase SoxD